jgi:FkbM family methyltransferase
MSRFLERARKLIHILCIPEWRHALLAYRVAAGAEHAVVLKQLGELQSVVDIGANRGQFALAARRCFPSAEIISFEPLSMPAGKYRSVFSDDERVILHEVAIGPSMGDAHIHLSARDDSSSLLPISEAQSNLFPGTEEIGTVVVKVAQLAAFLGDGVHQPALLKIDVQGFELQALSGCEPRLGYFDWIYVECSFVELYSGQALADEVIAWLQVRGWALSGVYNMLFDRAGKAIQADFLFSKR